MGNGIKQKLYGVFSGLTSKRVRKLLVRIPLFHGFASEFRWRTFMQPGDTVVQAGVDMGAKRDNGQVPNALSMSKVVGEKGRVIAVEPSQQNVRLLKSYIDLHNVQNITVVEKALWNKEKEMIFSLGKESWHNRLADLHSREDQSSAFENSYAVKADTLENILNDLGIKQVAHVCLTINGAEFEALTGMENVLRQEHVTLLVAGGDTQAFHQQTDNLATKDRIADFLRERGFKVTVDRIGWVTARK